MDYEKVENLAHLAKIGDKKAKEDLMLEFTPMILNLSKKSFINSYEFQDIKNECYKTLFKCVTKYNSDYHRFVSYATNAIKNSIYLLIRVSKRRTPTEGPEAFTLDGNLENIIYSDIEDFDIRIFNELSKSNLAAAFKVLTPDEQALILHVYYKNFTLKKYSILKGIPYNAAIYMKTGILYKLKQVLEAESNNYKKN